MPDPAKPGSTAKIRNDRDYQIAAAHFYSSGYDRAKMLFEQIAANQSSRWHTIAPYLLARIDLRQGDWSGAEQRLRTILDNGAESSMHGPAQSLLDYVHGHLNPAGQLLVLAKRLMEPDSQTLGKDLSDYTFLYDRLKDPYFDSSSGPIPEEKIRIVIEQRMEQLRAVAAQDELTGWILVFQSSGQKDRQELLARSHKDGSLPSLILALYYSTGKDPDVNSLIDAAMRVSVQSEAFPSVRFESARLMIEAGETERAASVLDEVLKTPATPRDASTANAFRAERMKVARSFEEFLAYAPRIQQQQDDQQVTSFDADATSLFNEHLPASLWLAAIQDQTLTRQLRGELAQAGWVRAVLVDGQDFAFGRELARLKPSYASSLRHLMNQRDKTTRTFQTAFWILRHPELQPWVRSGDQRSTPDGRIDELRDNWWAAPDEKPGHCGFDHYGMHSVLSGILPRLYTNDRPSARFLTAQEREANSREQDALKAAGAGPRFLASIVVRWAKSHPADSRNPEALGRAVRTSKFGCTDSNSAGPIREAFRLLHQRYADGEWARKTPYWY